MRNQILPRPVLAISMLGAFCALSNNPPPIVAQPSRQEAATNERPRIIIQANIASLNKQDTMTLAAQWMFGIPGFGRLFLINPTSAQAPGEVVGILTASQLNATFSAFEQRGCLSTFPGFTAMSGSRGKISLDEGQSLEVTPVVSTNGLSVQVSIKATLKKLATDNQQPLREISVTASVRDGQAVVLGQAASHNFSTASNEEGAKFVFVRAMIVDSSGKPLHEWEEKDTEPATRFYWDTTPHRHSAIPVQPPLSSH